jgi:hypothetical protein
MESNLTDSTNLDKSRRTIVVIEIDAVATSLSQPQPCQSTYRERNERARE